MVTTCRVTDPSFRIQPTPVPGGPPAAVQNISERLLAGSRDHLPEFLTMNEMECIALPFSGDHTRRRTAIWWNSSRIWKMFHPPLQGSSSFCPALYRVRHQLSDLGFICFLPRYCFLCPILLGQVGIRQNGQGTWATVVETTKSESTKDSPRVDA